MSKVTGLDELDEMFPSSPPLKNEEGGQKKTKAEVKDGKKEPSKKQDQTKGKASKPEDEKTKVLKEEPQKKEQQREKDIIEGSPSTDDTKRDLDKVTEDTFSVEEKKLMFIERHKQENLWLENELKEQLDEICKDKPKGFKTQFFNTALKFAVARYKESKE